MLHLKSTALFYNLFSPKCYIPKDALQQDFFLSKYPTFDGRGIKIAIIDGGIDVSLEGLQKTSDGLPKIIDCFDFTDAGDVDTSITKEADSKNILIGLSGRKFKVPQEWINPSGKWHLGLKALFKPSMFFSRVSEKLPEIDCIVWFNGEKWCACIETYEKDLKNAKILTNFCDNCEYGILMLNKLEMTYCITVHSNGNMLVINTPYNSHGSGVAQIAAANFPKNPEQNGLAPGAQIISMSVSGPEKAYLLNLEKMENIRKALLKCIEMNVELIIYSIASFYGYKEIGNLINEIFKNHNILIFKGSGNDGPFYTSVRKVDSNVADSVFTIGALLTPEMQKTIYYAKIDDNNLVSPAGIVYTFSSRGPGDNGSRGLDFVAPGAAITNVPRFAFEEKKCYVGTSYASPNAAGAVACLLSALKANSIQYSPASIKFALFKTAFLPENGNIFEFGHGIIQIDLAFEFFFRNMIDYKSISIQLKNSSGVVFTKLDGHHENIMKRDLNLSDFINIENADAKKWNLQISPNAENFIKVSEIDESHSFSVKGDTNILEEGNFYFGEIKIMNHSIGSIYNIPVNIVYPLKISETENFHIQKEITLNYENCFRFVFYPSFESSKIRCEIVITALENLTTNLCIQHVEYNNRFQSIVDGDFKKVLEFSPKNQMEIYSFTLEKHEIQEICIYATMPIPLKSNAKLKTEWSFK